MATTTAEKLELAEIVQEMLANAIVKRDNEVLLTYPRDGRVFMVEIRLVDCTGWEKIT